MRDKSSKLTSYLQKNETHRVIGGFLYVRQVHTFIAPSLFRFTSHCQDLCHLRTLTAQIFVVLKVLDSARLDIACANRTSAASESCPRVNASLPDMVLGTAPKDFFVAARCNVRRSQFPVHGIIPFTCQIGLERSKIVESCQHLSPCAIWAAGTGSARPGIGR